jgi:glyoxylase-like metal-dependent hydrolase (beta-lactamase superfamily II)
MYSARAIVDGFPGKTETHGSFGWSSVHVLRAGARVVLVETGPPSYIPLLSAALDQLGIARNDVTDVLITHAHWDHLGNVAMFPDARIWMGAGELDWALGLPADAPFMSQPHLRYLRDARVHEVADGDEFVPGITAFATPGHTPGHMAYVAHCGAAPIVFAGDAVKNLRELATLTADSTLDAATSHASMRRIREYVEATGALLVPGHDVPVRLERGSAIRATRQEARITFFASADDGPQNVTISDTPTPARETSRPAEPVLFARTDKP